MKALRIVVATATLCLANSAWAEINTLGAAQTLSPPGARYPQFGEDVAIDGGFIIVLARSDTGHAAYLYRRDLNTGKFAYQYALLELATGSDATAEVAMKNGIAAIRMGSEIRIFEHSGANYVHTHSAAPLTHPGGIAISGNSVLVGGDGCTDDAVVYQKGTDGNWGITGRLDDAQGACHPEGLRADLNYDYALLSAQGENHATAWRRGSQGTWAPAGTLALPSGTTVADFPFALENSTAVSPGNYVFRRSGSTWTRTNRFLPADFDNTARTGATQVVDRDGVLVTIEPTESGTPDYPVPSVYQETMPGHFEHVAMLNASARHVDASGHTVVAANVGVSGPPYAVRVFYLPSPLIPPSPIVADFESGDVSGFGFSGGQFALAQRDSGGVLAQNSATGLAVAVENDSDWSNFQSIQADFTPAWTNSDSWVGLVLRYVDASNFYYAIVRQDGTCSIYKRIDGIDTLLKSATVGQPPTHFAFSISGNGGLVLSAIGLNVSGVSDTTLTHGRAGVASFQTRADFDEVQIFGSAQGGYALFTDEIRDAVGAAVDGKNFSTVGGRWVKQFSERGYYAGISQKTLAGDALAFTGVPVENQSVFGYAHVDAFNGNTTGGWFGLLARYQDSKNYYYAAIRANNQIQIRKVVNGVITVLASAPFTPTPGRDNLFELRVINDELRLFVDQQLTLQADDGSFTSGQFGIGTHSATATWRNLVISQP